MLKNLFAKESVGAKFMSPAARTDASQQNMGAPVIPPIIGILGAKGGTGATSIATNLAAALAAGNIQTTIIDANFQQPDVAQVFGIEPEHSLVELLNRASDLDQHLFAGSCSVIPDYQSHLNILSPSLDGETGLKANLSQLAACFSSMRSYSEFWIIDLPTHLDRHLITLADLCDKILLVLEPNMSGVAACRRWLNIFHDIGYDSEKIICVVNRAGAKYTTVEQKLNECFSDQSIFRLPNASAAAWDCSIRGIPLVKAYPKHAYTKSILTLVDNLKNIQPTSIADKADLAQQKIEMPGALVRSN